MPFDSGVQACGLLAARAHRHDPAGLPQPVGNVELGVAVAQLLGLEREGDERHARLRRARLRARTRVGQPPAAPCAVGVRPEATLSPAPAGVPPAASAACQTLPPVPLCACHKVEYVGVIARQAYKLTEAY